jgi:hypothetical protein
MTPKKFICFFAYEYSKNAKFYVEVIGNKSTWKKLLAENFSKLVKEKSANSKFRDFIAFNFSISIFSRFSEQF